MSIEDRKFLILKKGSCSMNKVMIVDDSMIIRINLKKIFEKSGYSVVAEASNGQEAIEKFIQYNSD